MRPGPAALCPGTVVHTRVSPTTHRFRSAMHQVWVDPEDPEALVGAHPCWSADRPALAWLRMADHGLAGETSGTALAERARDELAPVLGARPEGPVRLLTQVRRFGWLFNPISVTVVWGIDRDRPLGLVAEVTNTPWKERHRYPVALQADDADPAASTAVFAKSLHVSPFLDEAYDYHLRLRGDAHLVALDLDVHRAGEPGPVVRTALRVRPTAPTRRALGRSLWGHPLSTMAVSAGIHRQAAALWRKGVPFVAHPRTRTAAPGGRHGDDESVITLSHQTTPTHEDALP